MGVFRVLALFALFAILGISQATYGTSYSYAQPQYTSYSQPTSYYTQPSYYYPQQQYYNKGSYNYGQNALSTVLYPVAQPTPGFGGVAQDIGYGYDQGIIGNGGGLFGGGGAGGNGFGLGLAGLAALAFILWALTRNNTTTG